MAVLRPTLCHCRLKEEDYHSEGNKFRRRTFEDTTCSTVVLSTSSAVQDTTSRWAVATAARASACRSTWLGRRHAHGGHQGPKKIQLETLGSAESDWSMRNRHSGFHFESMNSSGDTIKFLGLTRFLIRSLWRGLAISS